MVGSPQAFVIALVLVICWGLAGPLFHFSANWQLVINTATTILTFLMVFLIQNTQNRDAKAMHLKLDELIKTSPASDAMMSLEDRSDDELEQLEIHYKALSEKVATHRIKLKKK